MKMLFVFRFSHGSPSPIQARSAEAKLAAAQQANVQMQVHAPVFVLGLEFIDAFMCYCVHCSQL